MPLLIELHRVGAALAANTGAAGAMHRVGFFAAKAAPTGYADRLRIQVSMRQRMPAKKTHRAIRSRR
ncbi:hypothetical protein GEV38_01350 [Pseudomonas sp. 13159349]|nr:hypothetical protein GEV38_01350 [Pseudomonas sp. 13159349]